MLDTLANLAQVRVHRLHLPLALYALASLIHFAHNAEMLQTYPHMPAGLTRSSVYFAWIGVTSIGVVGYWLLRLQHFAAGYVVLAIYAMLGFSGLGHYALAPMSLHTNTMNATIWVEFGTAATLLIVIARHSLLRTKAEDESPGTH